METNKQRQTVCVTGATGFIASWLIKRLLESGYCVRGTVRDPNNVNKTEHLRALPGADGRLKLVKGELSNQGDFEEAFEGCSGVFHVAAPVHKHPKNAETEMVDAAVNGTLNVLRASKVAHVRRVVMTSSAAAVGCRRHESWDQPLDESDWSWPDYCRQLKLYYALSKTLAEKAAWEYASANAIDLVTLIPTFVVGYALPTEVAASVEDIIAIFKGGELTLGRFKKIGYVHLDDVASAEILLFEQPSAHGRYICSAVDVSNSQVCEFLRGRYPQYSPDLNDGPILSRGYNNAKLTKEFGFTYKGLEEMFDDSIASLQHKGLL